MTTEQIVAKAPKITQKDLKEINSLFKCYLFYESTNNGKKFFCTNCHKEFEVKYKSKNSDMLHLKHNELSRYPKCGKVATVKQKGKAKSCRSLFEFQRVVLIKPVSKNKIWCIYAYTTKNYKCFDKARYDVMPNCEINAIYLLQPKNVSIYKNNYWYGCGKENCICEPFTKTWYYNIYNHDNRGYTLLYLDSLKNTFLKYFDLKTYTAIYEDRFTSLYYCDIEIPYMKILCEAALHPITEYLVNSDFVAFLDEKIKGYPNKRLVN